MDGGVTPDLEKLASHIRGILQRGIDGLTGDEPAKRPTTAAILQALAEARCDERTAVAAAIEARQIAAAQNRAPNIAALYRIRLAEATAA